MGTCFFLCAVQLLAFLLPLPAQKASTAIAALLPRYRLTHTRHAVHPTPFAGVSPLHQGATQEGGKKRRRYLPSSKHAATSASKRASPQHARPPARDIKKEGKAGRRRPDPAPFGPPACTQASPLAQGGERLC